MADRVIAERFRLIEPLGRGGMGTVWRAQDEVLHRTVALKEVSLPPSLPDSEREAVRQRVLREARAAARLSHSSAVTVFDVLEDGDYTFIAMEMVDSPTLAQIVEENGPLAPERAAFIGLKLLDTLEAAHSKGIVHRDVKPANVMVSDRVVKLADFGIASVKGDPQLTATGLLLGSPSYMSPEQVSGRPAGPASDLWALGATLFYSVEGKGPFDREGPLPTLMAISKEAAPEPSNAGPLAPAIRSLLQKDPDRRATAGDLRSLLEPIAGSEAGAASPLGSATPEEVSTEPPNEGMAFLPPEAPTGLADFVTRHEGDDDREAPADPDPGQAPPPKSPRQDLLAAVPDIETTWHDEAREAPAVTVPVARPEAGGGSEPRPSAPASVRESADTDNRRWWAVGGALVLLLLALWFVPRMFAAPPPGAAEAPVAGEGDAAQAPAGGGEAPAPPPGAEARPPAGGSSEQSGDRQSPATGSGSNGSAGVPSGWETVELGDTGYAVSHPPSWSVRNNALGDGSSLRINGPRGSYLLVDWTDDPGPDALQAWETLAASFSQRHQNYREIRLERTSFQGFATAAIWEWTYTQRGADLRAANLGFADDDYGFALNFQTRASDWASSQDEWEAFKTSFRET